MAEETGNILGVASKLEAMDNEGLLEAIFGEGEQTIRKLAEHYDIDMSVADDENYLAVAICNVIESGIKRGDVGVSSDDPKEGVVDETVDDDSGVGISEFEPAEVEDKEADVGSSEDSEESVESDDEPLGDIVNGAEKVVPELNCEPGQIGDDPLLDKAGTIEVSVESANAITSLVANMVNDYHAYIHSSDGNQKEKLFSIVASCVDNPQQLLNRFMGNEPVVEEAPPEAEKVEPTTATELFDHIVDGYSLPELHHYVDLTEDKQGNWWLIMFDANPDDYPLAFRSKRNPDQLRKLFWHKDHGKHEAAEAYLRHHIENMVEQYSGGAS